MGRLLAWPSPFRSRDPRDVGHRCELRQRVVVDSGQGTTRITCVDDTRRLDEQRVDFPLRDRAVLDTARYDEQLAGAEPHVAVAQLNGQLTSNDDESSWFCSGTHRAASSSTSGRSRTPTPRWQATPLCTACTGRSPVRR